MTWAPQFPKFPCKEIIEGAYHFVVDIGRVPFEE
jgi:hypothetical protein